MYYRFEWDERKAQANESKHGVSFLEARSVFTDVFAVGTFDREHSADEDRFIMIGASDRGRVLLVAYTFREPDAIRIISTRVAGRAEQRFYEEQRTR
jgi:uncharacterized DUF497 family protein